MYILSFLTALVLLLLLAPFVAIGARGVARRAKGAMALGSVMLGLGAVLEPPVKHVAEAASVVPEPEGTGEPE